MNISATKIENCDGGVRDDRPEYVDDLILQKRVGFKDGSPVVGEPIPLSGDVSDGYSHYKRGDELFKPQSGRFLSELFDSDHITSVSDASRELNTDESVIEKAAKLHGIELPTGANDSPEHEPEGDTFVFPSGESWPTDLLADPVESDVRVLSQLLATNGMSTGEVAAYLSDRLAKNVTESDVRQHAEYVNVL